MKIEGIVSLFKFTEYSILQNFHYLQIKQELSSDDESKENENDPQPETTATISDTSKSKHIVSPEKTKKTDPTTPLIINCDTSSCQKMEPSKVLQ